MKILTSPDDDFLYQKLLVLLQQVKLVQGGTALASTLRRHNKLKVYLIEKQIDRIKSIEERYFNSDGSLDSVAIQNDHQKSLQNNKITVY